MERRKVTDTLGQKTHCRFIYRHRFQERFKALTIYLKVISILGVTDLNGTVWKHGFYNELIFLEKDEA